MFKKIFTGSICVLLFWSILSNSVHEMEQFTRPESNTSINIPEDGGALQDDIRLNRTSLSSGYFPLDGYDAAWDMAREDTEEIRDHVSDIRNDIREQLKELKK